MMLINKIISSIIEIILVGIVPFIWWIVTARKKENFFKWLGLKKIEKENIKTSLIGICVISILFMLLSIFTLYMMKDVETATTEFKGLGISGLLPALVYAIFNTSFPEEIFFRGFLQKRLSNKFGFLIANIVQSTLFGLIHGIMFFGLTGVLRAVMLILFTGTVAFAMGYLNEKKANSSIIPSWTIHTLSNIFSSIIAMFSIL